MPTTASLPSPPPGGPTAFEREDLERVGAALVQLDAWCRQRGLEEIATLIEAAADWADERLTRP